MVRSAQHEACSWSRKWLARWCGRSGLGVRRGFAIGFDGARGVSRRKRHRSQHTRPRPRSPWPTHQPDVRLAPENDQRAANSETNRGNSRRRSRRHQRRPASSSRAHPAVRPATRATVAAIQRDLHSSSLRRSKSYGLGPVSTLYSSTSTLVGSAAEKRAFSPSHSASSHRIDIPRHRPSRSSTGPPLPPGDTKLEITSAGCPSKTVDFR